MSLNAPFQYKFTTKYLKQKEIQTELGSMPDVRL
jgi:hypothetical protein